eukprot:1726870-Rhodomonas_salina.1
MKVWQSKATTLENKEEMRSIENNKANPEKVPGPKRYQGSLVVPRVYAGEDGPADKLLSRVARDLGPRSYLVSTSLGTLATQVPQVPKYSR